MRNLVQTSACLLASSFVSVPGFANVYQCSGLDAQGEELGILAPATERIYFEAFERAARQNLELESRQPGANQARINKELLSLEHQITLIRRTLKASELFSKKRGLQNEEAGEEFPADVRDAIADSDKGKLLERQKESWAPETEEQRVRSDAFLNLISLRPGGTEVMTRAQKILEEVLISDFDGKPGEGIFNAKFSNDQIREIVGKTPVMRGALHDLPGLYDAYIEFARTGNEIRFRNRVRYNFSHNGPGRNGDFSVFWGGLFKILLPGGLKAAGAAEFFEGTIYSRDGQIRYPEGSSKGWFLHTATDRLSGEVNLLKFMAEAGSDLEVLDIFASSYTTTGVITQLEWLEARLQEVGGKWNDPTAVAQMQNYIATLKSQQSIYARAIGERVQFSLPVEITLNGKPAKKVLELTITQPNVTEVVQIKVTQNETGAATITAGGSTLNRKQLIDLIADKLFTPISALDPLNQN